MRVRGTSEGSAERERGEKKCQVRESKKMGKKMDYCSSSS